MPATAYDAAAFAEGLRRHGLVVPSGVRGVIGRSAVFEGVVTAFDAAVRRLAQDDGAEEVHFPPTLPRALVERTGYMESFPQLAGAVHSFFGSELEARALCACIHAGEPWSDRLGMTDVMLTPAVCYPVYPTFAGTLSPEGRLATSLGWVFRHEPSDEPTRLQSFRMREYIRAGTPDQVVTWRNDWLERALGLLRALELPVRSDIANDPFFGKGGRLLAVNQREQQLKFEVLVPVISEAAPTAICSFNWHQDKFATVFGIHAADGAIANTACLGFGLERIAMALFQAHGFDPAQWPAAVRDVLWP
ncbi:amino acid--[acyl-carrier-protein] ligase [Dokdonella sp. MW10]|uniref:amino acid--[acyl-carrier-protein] ligase n=1 Tax=Dokdonella sp. MW10 TaxID=2992926 RepID=UPI003F7D3C37